MCVCVCVYCENCVQQLAAPALSVFWFRFYLILFENALVESETTYGEKKYSKEANGLDYYSLTLFVYNIICTLQM